MPDIGAVVLLGAFLLGLVAALVLVAVVLGLLLWAMANGEPPKASAPSTGPTAEDVAREIARRRQEADAANGIAAYQPGRF